MVLYYRRSFNLSDLVVSDTLVRVKIFDNIFVGLESIVEFLQNRLGAVVLNQISP